MSLLNALFVFVLWPDIDVVWLGYDTLDEDVRAAVDSVGYIEDEDSVCGLCEGGERGTEEDVFCFDACDDLSSERPLDLG